MFACDYALAARIPVQRSLLLHCEATVAPVTVGRNHGCLLARVCLAGLAVERLGPQSARVQLRRVGVRSGVSADHDWVAAPRVGRLGFVG